MTKLVALLGELRALKAEDKDARVIVFTAHDAVQQKIVKALGGKGWDVFEFNKQTAPTRRHRIIKEFQDGLKKDGKPKVCVATYATAAVGVTLTAANRVFLMEPSEDPATELQAAGRIHRLGQTKEVLIKRFAFRNTIEHVIVDLHEEIKAKRVKAGAGQNDSTIRQLFKKHNLHKDPHVPDPTMAQDFACEWKQLYGSTWWSVTRNKCLHCKRVYDNNVKKLAKRPIAAMEDKPHWALPNVVRSGESPLE